MTNLCLTSAKDLLLCVKETTPTSTLSRKLKKKVTNTLFLGMTEKPSKTVKDVANGLKSAPAKSKKNKEQ